MAFTIQNKGKEAALNGIGAVAVKFSLHVNPPGSTGTNEVSTSTGSPHYGRQTGSWNAASGGVKTLSGSLVFDVPAGNTVKYVGAWNTGGTSFYGYWDITPATFLQQGTLTVDTAELDM